MAHYENMQNKLNSNQFQTDQAMAGDMKLSLKLFANYGPVAKFTSGNRSRIFGDAVIEANSLMINSIDSSAFALIPDEFWNASP